MAKPVPMALVALLFLLSGCTASDADYETLGLEAWKARLDATPGAFVLDVRTPEEYEAGHIPDATLVPFDTIRDNTERLPAEKDTPVFVYCRTGNRSTQASETLVELGYTKIVNMRPGGFPDWQAAGHPIA